MIVIHASFPIAPERMDETLELVEKLVEASNREPGMIEYRAATDVHSGNTIRFFEQYEDADAFEAHTQTDHFLEFASKLPELLAGDPEVVRFDVDEATELEL